MKSLRISPFICFLSILSITPLVNFTSASSDLFHPPEGTVSTYRLNFNNFPPFCIWNGTHIDRNDYDFDNCEAIKNPSYAEFSLSYNMFGNFLEEVGDGFLHNTTTSVWFRFSFLINISTRLYVNEQGISWEEYTHEYIDPREISVGSQINIYLGGMNVTAKEIVNVTGIDREAWKLEIHTEFANETYYYDVITGILLSAKREAFLFGSSIGRSTRPILLSIHPFNQDQLIATFEQILISTNAWSTSHPTIFPLFEIILLLCVLTLVIKKNRI
ncbi:MAG: hypothetical protein ACFFDT_17340 [Candidatus Hodarchaeota archaeon]